MSPEKPAANRHVLVIEDNDGDIFIVKRAFAQAKNPATVSVATDGEKAMAVLKGIMAGEVPTPDLVMLDINLPVLNGDELLQYMKSELKLRAIPVVVFSSSYSQRDIKNMYDHHANSYITKPHDVEEYFSVIDSVQNYWFETSTRVIVN